MSSSSPQAKNARNRDSKSNGAGRATATEVKTATPAPAGNSRPTEEAIARRAYEIYEREGRQPGSELQNWLKAEAELLGTKSH